MYQLKEVRFFVNTYIKRLEKSKVTALPDDRVFYIDVTFSDTWVKHNQDIKKLYPYVDNQPSSYWHKEQIALHESMLNVIHAIQTAGFSYTEVAQSIINYWYYILFNACDQDYAIALRIFDDKNDSCLESSGIGKYFSSIIVDSHHCKGYTDAIDQLYELMHKINENSYSK